MAHSVHYWVGYFVVLQICCKSRSRLQQICNKWK